MVPPAIIGAANWSQRQLTPAVLLRLCENPPLRQPSFHPSTLRAPLSWHCPSPDYHVPHKAKSTPIPWGAHRRCHVEQPIRVSDFCLFFGAAGSNMFPHMLEPFCNSSICFWEMWRNLMIFSGVIKPTAVVINRGHSLLWWTNASHNSSLSHALSLMTGVFVSRLGLWTRGALMPALKMIHLQSEVALPTF